MMNGMDGTDWCIDDNDSMHEYAIIIDNRVIECLIDAQGQICALFLFV
jgi:hypothetical protein